MNIKNKPKRDIKIAPQYGDIVLKNSNIICNTNYIDILKDAVIERYKTAFGDFPLQPSYGSNISQYRGKGITSKLAESIVALLKYSLTYDELVDQNSLTISYIIITNNIYIRTEINLESDSVVLDSTYNSEGVFKIE